MADDRMYKNTEDIYRLLLSLKKEMSELTVQVRAMRKEMKGDDICAKSK